MPQGVGEGGAALEASPSIEDNDDDDRMEVRLGFSPEAGLWSAPASMGPFGGAKVPVSRTTASLPEAWESAEPGSSPIITKEVVVIEEITADLLQVPSVGMRAATLPQAPVAGQRGPRSRKPMVDVDAYPGPSKLLNYDRSFFVLEVYLRPLFCSCLSTKRRAHELAFTATKAVNHDAGTSDGVASRSHLWHDAMREAIQRGTKVA